MGTITEHEKGYLEGLQAAALVCQYAAGDRTSHLSQKIMALHSLKTLKIEARAMQSTHISPITLKGGRNIAWDIHKA